jgi:uncharacterized GH25 family protein
MIQTSPASWLCAFAIAVSASSPLAQAIRGKVVGPYGKPCADVEVFVVGASPGSRVAAVSVRGVGEGVVPLIRSRTNARGNFAFDASRMLSDGEYSLWVVSKAFADHRIDDVRRPGGGESNLGKIVLRPGNVVIGLVRTVGKGDPVAGATVRILIPTTQTPGRNKGWTAVTDESGRYTIRNAPAGWAYISAVAEGLALDFATVHLRRDVQNEHSFRLSPGRSVVGVVRDARGRPVSGARIGAASADQVQRMRRKSQKSQLRPMPLLVGVSDEKGRFLIPGVTSGGSYFVTAGAPGHLPERGLAIDATTKELAVELGVCPQVRMKILGKDGSALSRFRVRLVRGESHARVTGFSRPVVVGGVATLTDLPVGSYYLDVLASGYAPKVSAEFTLDTTTRTPLVKLQLNAGGSLTGKVVDAAGKPIAGAVVTPRLPSEMVEIPLAKMFMIKTEPAKYTTTTDAKGGFRIPLMQPGSYLVSITHDNFVRTIVGPVKIELGEVSDSDKFVVHTGVRVFGVTTAGGQPNGGMRVQFRSDRYNFQTTSDAEGKWELPEKIAPGRYTVIFAVTNEVNPLLMMVDFKKSKRQIDIKVGKAQKVELDLVK